MYLQTRSLLAKDISCIHTFWIWLQPSLILCFEVQYLSLWNPYKLNRCFLSVPSILHLRSDKHFSAQYITRCFSILSAFSSSRLLIDLNNIYGSPFLLLLFRESKDPYRVEQGYKWVDRKALPFTPRLRTSWTVYRSLNFPSIWATSNLSSFARPLAGNPAVESNYALCYREFLWRSGTRSWECAFCLSLCCMIQSFSLKGLAFAILSLELVLSDRT